MDVVAEFNATFNIFVPSLFDVVDDSRSSHFDKRWNDVDQSIIQLITSKDPLEVWIGPSKVNKFKDTFDEHLDLDIF